MGSTPGRRRTVRASGASRAAALVALVLCSSLAIAGARAEDESSSPTDGAASDAVSEPIDADFEAYDPTEHFAFEEPDDGWKRTSEDEMPRVAFEIIDVAAGIADREGSGDGQIKDKAKRQDYQDLAAFYHAQSATIASFNGREDLHPDGACEREIKQLCGPDDMDDSHVTKIEFTKTTGHRDDASSDDSSDASAAAVTERRARRALLADPEPDPWGVDEDDPEAEMTEKDRRIRDLEDKVNALAGLIENVKGGAAGIKARAFSDPKKAHRPYRSFFECVHTNMIDVHNKRAKHVVSKECADEVRETYSRRFSDIRGDATLMEMCGGGHKGPTHDVEFAPDPDDDKHSNKNEARGEAIAGGDIGKFCSGVKPGLGLVFRCLKSHKTELEPACAKVVSQRQIEQAEDISLDAPLSLMCEDDRAKLCADKEWGGGLVEQCLKDARSELSTQCKLEVFRREVEESEDVRYDAFLSEACAPDVAAFCDGVKPGDGRVMACLESHANDAKFTADCRAILDRRVVRRAADWRLDFSLRRACVGTVKSMCRAELDAAKAKVSSSGSILECLKKKLKDGDVDDEECKREVSKKMVAAASDIREDTALTLACKSELTELCAGVQPGEGRLWTCLAANRAKASKECDAKLFEREVWMSGDWRYKYALASKCAAESQMLCQGVAPGGGRVIKCLQEKLKSPKMGKECRDAVFADQARAHGDIRLHQELTSACAADVKDLCAPVNPGEGRVIKCLKEKRADVKAPECRNALLRLMMSQADNYLLDAPLSAACHDDVVQHCSDIQPGQGRVHECLRAIPNALSPACKAAETSAEAQEAEDIRLKPQLLEACQVAGAQLCAGVEPGHGRLLECLLGKASDPTMDRACAKKLSKHAQRANKHMAFDIRVKRSCGKDLERLCGKGDDAAANEAAAETPGVEDPLICLTREEAEIEEDDCRAAVRKSVRRAFTFYRVGAPATAACDDAATRLCGASEDVAAFQAPGSVLSCLRRNVDEAGDACWRAVSADLPDSKHDVAEVGAIAVAKDTAAMEADIGRAVESRVLEEVSNRIATQSSSVQAAAQRAVAAMQAKADSLAGVVGVLGFALVGVAGVAFLALRRMMTLLANTRGGKGGAHRAHNV